MTITESQLLPNFNAMSVVRAREYERSRRVMRAEIGEDGYVYGRVKGSNGAIYDQVIALNEDNKIVSVYGDCTCPVENNCKHVAAVLFSLVRRKGLQLEDDEGEEPKSLSHTSPQLEGWLTDLEAAMAPPNEYEPDVQQRLLYVLSPAPAGLPRQAVLKLVSARLLKSGAFSAPNRFSLQAIQNGQFAKYVRQIDKSLVTELFYRLRQERGMESTFRLQGATASKLMGEILETGRCHWLDIEKEPLSPGPLRSATPEWIVDAAGCQSFYIPIPGSIVLPMAPPYYVDMHTLECGPVETGLTPEAVEALMIGPPIYPEHSSHVRESLGRLFASAQVPLPEVRQKPTLLQEAPVPFLSVRRVPVRSNYTGKTEPLPCGRLEFQYGPLTTNGYGSEVRGTNKDGPIVIMRNSSLESAAYAKLEKLGWHPTSYLYGWSFSEAARSELFLTGAGHSELVDLDQLYYRFLHVTVPYLRELGWRIDVPEKGSVIAVSDSPILLQAHETGVDWFNLELGVLVGEHRIDLRPILVKALQTMARLKSSHADEDLYCQTDDGNVLVMPLSRVRPLLAGLIELFGPPDTWSKELQIPKARAAEMVTLDDMAGVGLDLPEKVRDLAKAFASAEGMCTIPTPSGFVGELREYQLEGISWIKFLADFELGGILADDMGLGKTIQTLAHIAGEKERGRLDRPALIVAPTSTIPNWQSEAEKFTPGLKVLTLHGPKRKEDFASIPNFDVVLTSYPLLARDKSELTKHDYHVAILDEAQNIKNHTTNTAKAAYSVRSRHRLCLSGTPVENRLEELWSIYRFATPGLLGTQAEFKKEFLVPIEKLRDMKSNARLGRRIRPFVMRRRKEQVAKELPPKTIIVDRVELEGGQRDFYESLRLAMDKRVRSLVSSKGLEKSRIEVLDALLKLRQVCCDPRLVKLPTAKKVEESAKLERLIEMVDQLISEGRRALIFSQFTSMLDLIEIALKERRHTWVRISGDTTDRKTPVDKFQNGLTNLFLISLKAGGTGLNLTAADTVIHYDPWWNPAVENQATDRAHRIGQDKPVFVYKMVATGTVEEKILELQERKADLAEKLLSGTADSLSAFSSEDLEWILS